MSGFKRIGRIITPTLAKFSPVIFPPGGFSANYPSGLQRWWDAQTLSSLHQDQAKTTPVTSNNDPVGSWTDLKNSIQAYQATAANKPLYHTGGPNGSAYLQGDGISDYISVANFSLTDFTIFFVSAIVAFDAGRAWFGDGASGFYRTSSTTPHTHYRSNATQSLYTLILSAVDLDTFYIFTLRREGTTLTLRMNGAIGTTEPSYTVDTEALNVSILLSQRSSDYFSNHKLCELLFYNRALALDERTIVEGYLAKRYLITLI